MSNVDKVEIQNVIFVGVRIIKIKNGAQQGFHRTCISPGMDVNKVLNAVNADLTAQGFDLISDWSMVVLQVNITQTPAVIASYNQAIANAKSGLIS